MTVSVTPNSKYPGVLQNRHDGPVLYGEEHYPAEEDRVVWGFIVATWILVLAAFLPYLSFYSGKKLRAILNTTVFASLYVGCVIMVCNFGMDWQTGYVTTRTQFAAGSPVQVRGEVGLHIGLRGINVTFVGVPRVQNNQSLYYNEDFLWAFQQGIPGRGIYAGRITREYFAKVMQGIPLPILQVAEWFTLEGEYIHWARFYRVAGLYTHILSWISFVCWGLTNICFLLSLPYAAMGTIATGWVMILANIVWAGEVNMSLNPLVIPFRDGFIHLSYGWSFWLNLWTGIVVLIAGVIFMFLLSWPRTRAWFIDQSDESGSGRALSSFFHSRSQFFGTEKAEIVEMAEVEAKRDADDKKNDDDISDDESDGEPSSEMKGKEAQDKMVSDGVSKRKVAKKKAAPKEGVDLSVSFKDNAE